MKYILLLLTTFICFNVTNVHSQSVYNDWETTTIVDEFGDETDEFVFSYFTTGTFTDSPTSNTNLTVEIVDLNDSVWIKLYKGYRESPVTFCIYRTCSGEFTIKTDDGTSFQVTADAESDVKGLVISDKDVNTFRKLMRTETNLRVMIKDTEFGGYGRSVYKFSIVN